MLCRLSARERAEEIFWALKNFYQKDCPQSHDQGNMTKYKQIVM